MLTLRAGCLKQEGCSSSSTSSSTWVVLHLYIPWNPAKMIFVYTRGSLGLFFCCRFLSLSSCYIYRPWAFLYSHVYQKFRSHSTVINSWYNFLHMTEENYIVFIGTNVFFCYSGYLVPTIFQMSLNMPNVFILVESSTFVLSLYFSREVFIANLICLESEYLYPGTCIMVHVLLMKCILKFGVSNINIHNSTWNVSNEYPGYK